MNNKLWPVSVKGVIFDTSNKVLLLKNPRNEWELPGGRLELNESPRECLAREIIEECKIVAIPGKALSPHVFEVIPGKYVLLVPFLCTMKGLGEVTLSNEHSEACFFATDSLTNIPIPPEYISIIREASAMHDNLVY